MKTLDDANLAGQRVLVRVDINVPIKDGVVGDRTRIRAIVPTVKAILDAGGKPLLVAHLGRPKGSVVPELSLAPLQPVLTEELGAKVVFAGGITGADIETQTHALAAGEVLLLENVRFAPGEEANAPEFAAELAALADVYVNDAFSAAHRAHASTEGVAGHLPALAGRQMEAELTALSRALEQPERPTMAVVGGAKVSTKIDVLTHLVSKVDRLVVGGGMANTFLLALGHPIGRSLAEPDLVDTARTIMEVAKGASCDVLLPVDVVVAKEFAQNAANRVLSLHEVADDDMILDVGPVTIDQLKGHVDESRTILWNGPLGAFEIAPFGDGTFALAQHAAARTRDGHLVSVAGGGDTVAALNAAGVGDAFTYVSTAGGAFLEFLEGRELPGVAALMASKA